MKLFITLIYLGLVLNTVNSKMSTADVGLPKEELRSQVENFEMRETPSISEFYY